MMSEPNPNILTDAWIAINIFTDVYGAKRLYFVIKVTHSKLWL